jgi:hypothetical protein
MGTMFKTGGQLLGINGAIYGFNTSIASVVKPMNPQPPLAIADMCFDQTGNRLFVATRGTGGQIWVYSADTLTRTNIIAGFSAPFAIRKDPNLINNRIVVYDFNNAAFMFIDLTTLALSSTTVPTGLGSKFEYDPNPARNKLITTAGGSSITILNAATFGIVQQIIDPLFQGLGTVKRNAHNPDEVFIFSASPTVIMFNLVDLSYTFKTLPASSNDADVDPNLANNKIYVAYAADTAAYTASDFGFIQKLNTPPAYIVIADPVVSNHRLFMGGGDILYAVTLG